mgnify:CR=1 FL=1
MKLFDAADEYCRTGSWKTFALLKFCLFAIGMMAGMCVPKEKKKIAYGISGMVFLGTYVPLMKKFFHIILKQKRA